MRLKGCLWRGCHTVCMTISLMLVSCSGNQAPLEVWLKNRQFVSRVVGDPPIVEVWEDEASVQRIYIEGDGKAYRSPYEPSGDPTPENPVGLRLFMEDEGSGKVYLGRPCQWTRNKTCMDRGIWTERRFSLEMVEFYVREVARLSEGRQVELVGYSGGAWLALQVAARLPNVSMVRTVAGNVDPEEVNRIHGVSRIFVAGFPQGERLREVSQVHVLGVEDKVVTEQMIERYLKDVKPRCVRVERVAASHGEGWIEKWPYLLKLECQTDVLGVNNKEVYKDNSQGK